MNNILTFEDYKKMNIRQVESVIYRQFIEEDIKDKEIVNEGIIRNAINKASGKFIQTALADEIEKGKELEKSIKEALDGLNKGFDEIEKQIGADDDDTKSKSKLARIEKVKEAIKAVQSQAFDTLTMIGSEGEIDFAGFLGSGTVAAAANFGILFSPIRSLFITRKAYKYFLGIIKQTIRRNLLIIQLNFDQFENLILQKSFETEDDSEITTMRETLNEIINSMQRELIGKDSKLKFTGKKGEEMRKYLSNFKETQNALIKQHKEDTKNNPLSSLWSDQYNNTYTKTLEQIKQYINEDSQKELDALKNSITKMAGNDVELLPYGELLISAAEEYAIHTNHGINNNFIKMSSVFNLDNQKKLIELIVNTQKEKENEINRKKKEKQLKEREDEIKKRIKDGKKLYEEKLKDSDETYTLDEFEKEFEDDDIQSLRAFFNSEEGADAYEELIGKHPSYKYYIMNNIETLNSFLSSINDLKIVSLTEPDDYYSKLVNRNQALYYTMAERSIKDAVNSVDSDVYFGFKIIDNDKYVDDNILVSTVIDGTDKDSHDYPIIDIIENELAKLKRVSPKDGRKYYSPRYFLTFNGSGNGLFDILHNAFGTKMFTDDRDYESNISTKSKEDIMKLIFKPLKIGKNISTQFAEYLVRLEAHMLLDKQKPWFVVKDNEVLKDCFDLDSDKIKNKNAFVEIGEEDYADIKKFLTRLNELSDNDFNLEDTKKEDKTK